MVSESEWGEMDWMVCGFSHGVWFQLWFQSWCVVPVMVCGFSQQQQSQNGVQWTVDSVWFQSWCVVSVIVCGFSHGVWFQSWCGFNRFDGVVSAGLMVYGFSHGVSFQPA